MSDASNYLIVIDDGHFYNPETGESTPGKRTPPFPDIGEVIHENEFNRPTALKLIKALKRCNFRTIGTTPGEKYVSLSNRVAVANDNHADLFISIHYDAYKTIWDLCKGGRSIYYWKSDSKKLATMAHKYISQCEPMMPDRGIKTSNFYVITYTNMPSILCELGFMDVLFQAKLMLDENYQNTIAETLCKTCCEYFGVEYILPNKEEKELLELMILYLGTKDMFIAGELSEKYGVPMSSIGNYLNFPDKNKAKKYIQVGGTEGLVPQAIFCGGKDFPETIINSLKQMGRL